MEKLLAARGVKNVSYVDLFNKTYLYFYTEKLLLNRIFIEFYESENEEDLDSEETDEGNPKYLTNLLVFMEHEGKSYEFTVLYDTRPFVPRMYLFRIILDIVEVITSSDLKSIIENLESSAEVSLTNDVYNGNKKMLKSFTERVRGRIERVCKLISEKEDITGKR